MEPRVDILSSAGSDFYMLLICLYYNSL